MMTDARLIQFALILAALAGLIPAEPAGAQVNAADLKAISDCLAKADKADSLGTACIGRIADPCIGKADRDTAKSRACAERELAVWNAVSEAASKRVRAGGFKEITKALTDSQKSWAQHRDALCPFFDKVEPGSLPGDAAYCRMQVTAQRALLLRRLGDAVNER
jgi:uncharacterized protein YecT (DUF1311 family)